MRLRSIATLILAVCLAFFGCGKRLDQPPDMKASPAVPELDVSPVAGYVEIERAEAAPNPQGTVAHLEIVLKVLKDFDGKILVIETFDAKTGGVSLGSVRLPAPKDGKISAKIESIDMWQNGKGVFRLVDAQDRESPF